MAKGPSDAPFFVRQSGLEYGDGKGAITGYDTEDQAKTNCEERNKKAETMGLKARYEVVSN